MGLSGSLLPGAVHVTLILHYFLGWHIPLFWGPKAIQTGVNSSYFSTCPDLWFWKTLLILTNMKKAFITTRTWPYNSMAMQGRNGTKAQSNAFFFSMYVIQISTTTHLIWTSVLRDFQWHITWSWSGGMWFDTGSIRLFLPLLCGGSSWRCSNMSYKSALRLLMAPSL